MVNVSELLINTVSRDERNAIVVSINYPFGRISRH